jgi:hypothetical protein
MSHNSTYVKWLYSYKGSTMKKHYLLYVLLFISGFSYSASCYTDITPTNIVVTPGTVTVRGTQTAST